MVNFCDLQRLSSTIQPQPRFFFLALTSLFDVYKLVVKIFWCGIYGVFVGFYGTYKRPYLFYRSYLEMFEIGHFLGASILASPSFMGKPRPKNAKERLNQVKNYLLPILRYPFYPFVRTHSDKSGQWGCNLPWVQPGCCLSYSFK